MSDAFVGLDEPTVIDKKLDMEQLTVGVDTVLRERVQIAGTGASHLAPVSATLGLSVNVRNLEKLEDSAHVSADPGVQMLAVRTDTPATRTDTDGDYEPLQMSGGLLWVRPKGFLTPNGDSMIDDTNDALRISVVNDSVGSTVDTEDGSVAAGQTLVALTIGMPYVYNGSAWVRKVTPHVIDDATFTPGTDGVIMAGFEADETGTDSVNEGDAGAARITLDRKQIVTPQPHTQGGLLIYRSLDLDEGTLEVIKAAPGQLYGWYIANRSTATRYIKFYNATSGTAGTGTPVMTLVLPGNATDSVAANALGTHGITFDTGICFGATTGVADNDTGAPGTNDVVANIFYF